MKALRCSTVSVICGLAFGIVAVWSSAAPRTINAAALRGGDRYWCNCTEGGTCKGTYTGCTSGYLARCHTGSGTDKWCKDLDQYGGTCAGGTECDQNSDNVEEQDCYS